MRICEHQMVEWGDSERRKGTEGGRARPMYPCCSAGHTMPSTRLGPKALLLPWAQPDPFPMTLRQIWGFYLTRNRDDGNLGPGLCYAFKNNERQPALSQASLGQKAPLRRPPAKKHSSSQHAASTVQSKQE